MALCDSTKRHGFRGADAPYRHWQPGLGPAARRRPDRLATFSPGSLAVVLDRQRCLERPDRPCSRRSDRSGDDGGVNAITGQRIGPERCCSGRGGNLRRRQLLQPGDVDLCREPSTAMPGQLPAASDSRDIRRDRRHGPLYGPRLRDGGRVLVRSIGVQSRHAGAAAAGFLVQADRLCGGASTMATRRRPSCWMRRFRDRSGWRPRRLAPANDDGKSGGPHTLRYGVEHSINLMTVRLCARHRHASDRRICQALRHL